MLGISMSQNFLRIYSNEWISIKTGKLIIMVKKSHLKSFYED